MFPFSRREGNEDKAFDVREVAAPPSSSAHNAIGERACSGGCAQPTRGSRWGLGGLSRFRSARGQSLSGSRRDAREAPVTRASRKGSRPFIIRHVMHAAPKCGASRNCFAENRVPWDTRVAAAIQQHEGRKRTPNPAIILARSATPWLPTQLLRSTTSSVAARVRSLEEHRRPLSLSAAASVLENAYACRVDAMNRRYVFRSQPCLLTHHCRNFLL